MASDSLVEALQTRSEPQHGSLCKFTQIRSRLTDDEQEALDKAVESIRSDSGVGKAKTFSASWLTKVLRNFGHPVSISTVQRHVNKECSCERIG